MFSSIRWRADSIRWRIAIPYVLLILATMLALGIYLSNFVRQTYLNDLEDELTAEARLAAADLGPLLSSGAGSAGLDELARRWAGLLGARVTIIAADGTVLGESHEDRLQMENHLTRPEIQQALAQGRGSSTRFSSTTGYQMMYTAVTVTESGRLAGFVRIALPLQEVQANTRHLQSVLASATLAAALLAVLLALWIAGRTTRPLSDLTRAAGRLAQGELDMPLLSEEPGEVGQLNRAFNAMAVQLKTQIGSLVSERSKLAAVLSEMSDGVLIVDAGGQVQLTNRAAEEMFQVDGQAALGRTLAGALRIHQVVELWQRCLETGDVQTAPLEIAARGLYLQAVAAPLGDALPGSTLLLFQNLTQVRRLETVRRDFISNISHELRTPLASLKALTETLQEGALEDPPAARRFLSRMDAEVDALTQMVAELLELARIESGRVPLQLQPASPCAILSSAVERLRLQSERGGLSIAVDCPEDLPPVLADPQRLEQVAVNLLHNAIKFTPAGGRILLAARQEGEMVRFSVSDTGRGIPALDLPRIFERFYKADRARSSGGTGLGLAISRHLVEAHGGRIWAESVEGEGSTFFFTIPIAG